MPSVKSLHYKDECATNPQLKKKTQKTQRPQRAFIYIHLVWRRCDAGRDPNGFTCWFRRYPGWLSWFLCLTTAHMSIQVDVPLHPMSQPNNLIQHQCDVYHDYVQDVYTKKCKVALFTGVFVFVFVEFFLCAFSGVECSQMQFFFTSSCDFPHGEERHCNRSKLTLLTPESDLADVWKVWIWSVISLHLSSPSRWRRHIAGSLLTEEGSEYSILQHRYLK